MRWNRDLGLGLDAYLLGQSGEVTDPEGCFATAYDLSPLGAVVVRPGGFVGWRAKDASTASKATMTSVMASLLCRDRK
jgi:putative polyketide hydroxylase